MRIRRRYRLRILAALVVVAAGATWFAIRHGRAAKANPLRQEAAAAIEARRFDQALGVLGKMIAASPRDTGLRTDRARCLFLLGRVDEAEEAATSAVALDAAYAPAHEVLAAVRRSRGDVAGALDEARRTVRGNQVSRTAVPALVAQLLDAGLDAEVATVIAGISEDDRLPQGSDETLAAAIPRLDPDSKASRRAVSALRAQCDALATRLRAAPGEPATLRALVRGLLALGDANAAAAALVDAQCARALTPAESVLHARTLAACGNRDRAQSALREAVGDAVEESSGVAATFRDDELREAAAVAFEIGLAAEAADWNGRVLARRPHDVAALRLALALRCTSADAASLSVESADVVEAAASAVLAERPNDEAALRIRIRARIVQGRLANAFEDVLSYRRQAPDAPAGAWLHGLCLLADGRSYSALVLLRAGRSAADSPRHASECIARAGVGARDASALAAESAALDRPQATALAAAANAVLGRWEAAERLAASPDFAECDVADRILAGREFVRGKRDALAAQIADGLDPSQYTGATAAAAKDFLALVGRGPATDSAASPPPPGGPARLPDAVPPSATDTVAARPAPDVASQVAEARRRLDAGDYAAAKETAGEILAAHPAFPDALAVVLEADYRSHSPDKELEESAERLLAVDPGDPRARAVRARALWRRFRGAVSRESAAAAEEMIAEVVRLTPQDHQARLWLGALQAQLGDEAAADRQIEALESVPEMQHEARVLLGSIRYAEGRYLEAAEAFRAALRASELHRANALAGLTAALLAAGDAAGALEAAHDYELAEPGSFRALEFRCLALSDLGRIDEAAAALRAAFASDPNDAPERLLLGRILLRARRNAEAAAVFREVIAAFPDDAIGYQQTMRALAADKRFDDAARLVEEAQARPSLGITGLLLRAALAAARNRPEERTSALLAAVERMPKSSEAHVLLGAQLLHAAKYSEATAHLETARALSPRDIRPWLLLGTVAERQRKFDDALTDYREAMRLAPHDPVAANNVAQMLLRGGQSPAEALDLARGAVRRGPKVPEFHDTFAQALAESRRYPEAVAEADIALALGDGRAELALSAAKVYVRAGATDQAKKAASLALAWHAPHDEPAVHDEAAAVLARLKKRR